jgi:uncharacterized membrane protein
MHKFSLYLMAAGYFGAGIIHLLKPRSYLRMMPPWVPMPMAAVLVSGVLEIVFGLGLLFSATRTQSAWGIILLLIAVFPANVYMLTSGKFPQIPKSLLMLRLPLQWALIWWAYQYV